MTPEAQALLTKEGFIRMFYQHVRDNPEITHQEAYEKTEAVYKKHFGRHKYSNFDSFRKVKAKYLRKR